ncbi:class III lanthionine synthetase LanKC [Streptomyces chromofuscus]|uniref:non-specific serine/threonine protein kinase n=1 Tax=Streptomyces chromofuscus TaxID=42881 RepID=A0A7M2T4U0_STRCW|nr:class III lanthionine synthetase LanKC [Streptomyces chromofuscus]QOV43697.1 class III lanthionine synthetase LanKC [Streptomyces chromofuscus]GGT35011.1 serine/threonine protein kinase [Streptomyces chromofuscus]
MENYLPYCQANKLFYDRPSATAAEAFKVARRSFPEEWTVASDDHWTYLSRNGATLREQGWKIHVSVVPEDAEEVIGIVADYCLERGVDFKFLTSPKTHLNLNSKNANRGSSGKLITIYPADDDAALAEILGDLSRKLEGRTGPYILSDLRWGDGPLYVRFGGFRKMYCTGEDGREALAIRRPDGTLEPDRRQPQFHVPEWVPVPAPIAEMMAAQAADSSGTMPYTVERALHFSNGGGIYLARDNATGRQVVLREARPFAGLDGGGNDAVARLHREAETLQALADLDFVPDFLGTFTVWEHHFLVEEYIEGETLWTYMASRTPFTDTANDPERAAEYVAGALELCDQLEQALGRLHERGYVFADLHPRNVMVRPDGRVALVDFEVAYRPDNDPTPTLGCPGFITPKALAGPERDQYALDCIRLAMFMPLTPMLDLANAKVEEFTDAIAAFFPSAATAMASTRDRLRHTLGVEDGARGPGHLFAAAADDPAGPAMEALIDALAQAITASATPERADRLFPGDPRALNDGGYGLAHGAAGVLFALRMAGREVDSEHVDWLAAAAQKAPARAGLYDGLHGAALVLHGLGREEEALRILERVDAVPLPGSPSLSGGLAGIGLVMRYFAAATGDERWRRRQAEVLDRLTVLVSKAPSGATRSAGLMDGWAGAASLFLSSYEDFQAPAFLDLARQAIGRDLAASETKDNGEVLIKDGIRLVAYLGDGSSGLAEPIARYLRLRPDENLAAVHRGILAAAQPRFTIESGLDGGRSGLLTVLAAHPDTAALPEILGRQIRSLSVHAVPLEAGIAFPGRWLLRLSMDLATGTAGVLYALHAARNAVGGLQPGGGRTLSTWSHATGLPFARPQ